MDLFFEFIQGMAVGIEHISGDTEDDEDFIEWAIVVHLTVFRISLVKLKYRLEDDE
jgi:hypothetical protein